MRKSKPTTLGAYQAKAHFSELLERVEAGEQITITRHGSAIARLVPVRSVASEDARRAAILAMRELAHRNRLNGLSVKNLRAQGRK
jgi:prevent-host-death family protein